VKCGYGEERKGSAGFRKLLMRLVGWLVINSIFSTNRLHHATGLWTILCGAGGQDKHTVKQYTKPYKSNTLWPGFCGDDPLAMIRLPQGSLSSQSLDKYRQLNQNNRKTEHTQMQSDVTQKGALINSNTVKEIMLRERTDRAWFSRLLRHLARKRSVSILTTPESPRGRY